MADILTLKKFEALSPFEIKDELIKLAKAASRTSSSICASSACRRSGSRSRRSC